MSTLQPHNIGESIFNLLVGKSGKCLASLCGKQVAIVTPLMRKTMEPPYGFRKLRPRNRLFNVICPLWRGYCDFEQTCFGNSSVFNDLREPPRCIIFSGKRCSNKMAND